MANSSLKIPVTVVIPTKNEEKNIARCLSCLSEFAEIVLIDSNSTDKTIAIAKTFDVKVVNFTWNGNFPKKRNWYLVNFKPKNPWVFFVDADEFVNQEFVDELRESIDNSCSYGITGFWISYTNYFLGKPLRHGLEQKKLALFKVGHGFYEKIEEENWSKFDMEIHEHPIITGKIGSIRSKITHHDFNGIEKFVNKHIEYALWESRRHLDFVNSDSRPDYLTTRQIFKYSNITKPWFPSFYFIFTYFIKLGFLDGTVGLQYAFYKAWYFNTVRILVNEKIRENT